jgi:hypothetical protein
MSTSFVLTGSLNVNYFLSINQYWSHNSNSKKHRAYTSFSSEKIGKSFSKIHGCAVFVENMVKIAIELVSSPLKGGIKEQPYA